MPDATITNTLEVPAIEPAYDPIKMLKVYLKSNPDAPSFLSNYLICRLGDQIVWYDKRSGEFKRTWMKFRRWVIILSASIPFLVGLIGMNWGDKPNEYLDLIIKFIVGAAGVVIAVLEGLNSLYKSQEFYIDYRVTAEQLRQEFCLFLGKGGIYENLSDALCYSKLIVRCESIMASENSKWAEIARQNEKSTDSAAIQNTVEEFLKKYKFETFTKTVEQKTETNTAKTTTAVVQAETATPTTTGGDASKTADTDVSTTTEGDANKTADTDASNTTDDEANKTANTDASNTDETEEPKIPDDK